MLRLVLVEDEIHTANLIKNAISWNDFGIDSCEVFYDGLSAYNHISKHGADIVITDIKMPIMDGMTLIEKCRNENLDILFIIITGHREFRYAYKAIKYDVFDYVLKPIQLGTFSDILKKAVKKLDKPDPLDTLPFRSSRMSSDIQGMLAGIFYNVSGSVNSHYLDTPDIPESILNNPCVLVNLNFINFDDFISNHWKYSTSQFKNAVMKITSFETDAVYFVTLNYWFDEMFLLAISKDEAGVSEDIPKYMEHIKNNFRDIFALDIEYVTISEFASLNQLVTSVRKERKSTDEDIGIIEKCKAYIYDNLNKQITLSDLAEHVFLNPIYLSSYFKEKTGENFSAYLKNVRIERAKQLLKKIDLPISQIYEEVGFKSESYFYKLFKSVTGITPQQYREQKSENK